MIGNIQGVVVDFGYLAIFALMFGESALVPFPSEITMTFAGYLAGLGQLNLVLVVVVGFAGNLLGSTLSYGLGVWKGAHWAHVLVKKWGGLLLLEENSLNTARKWFKKYGPVAVLVSRLLPVVRAFISLPAGIAKMPFPLFLALTSMGSFVWVLVLTLVGYKLGENWELIESYFGPAKIVLGAAFVLAIILYFVVKIRRSRGI